jgi:hypothetical protein
MNIVEFIVKLRDGLSDPLKKVTSVSGASTNALDKLSESNKKLKGLMGSTSDSANDLRTKISKLQEFRDILPANSTKQIQKINTEIDKLTGKITKIETMQGGGMKSYFSSMVSQIPPIFTNPIFLIGAGVTATLNQGMKNSKTKLELGNLVGKEAGADLYKSLTKLKPVMGDEVFDFGKKLVASGVASDKVSGTLNRLGDVANGNKQSLAGLVDTFAEMRVEGKFNEEGFKKLGLLGFNPLTQLSKMTGQSMATLTKKMQEGKISVSDIEKALEAATSKGGQFYGNMEAINSSPTGKLDILLAKLANLGSIMGEYLMPVFTTVIGYAVDSFEWLSQNIEAVVQWMQPLVAWGVKNADMLGLLGSVLAGVVIGIQAVTLAKTIWITVTGGLTTAIQVMSAAIMNIPVIGWILAAIAAIIAAIVYLRAHFTGFGKFFENLWIIAKANWTYFVSNIKQGFDSIWYYMQLVWLKLKSFGQYIGELFSNIGESLKLAAQFKFSEAKAKLTAEITTEASKEIEQLDKEHDAKQDGYKKEQMDALKTIMETPLKGIIKAKEDTEDANAATEDAFGKKSSGDMKMASTDAKVADGVNAISGGGVKNITVTIGKMIESSYITVTQETKQAAKDLERMIEEGMVRAVASASGR